ncbi:MFS transporter [Dendronalium sp. ChiSLP03b]|nr:MFS transporter [Dendronalium sp. ChiSLP03b]MDZ8202909.1 MFS transporter [Dendronalium sp. ChiSLP03b]
MTGITGAVNIITTLIAIAFVDKFGRNYVLSFFCHSRKTIIEARF